MANHGFAPNSNFTFEDPGVFRLRAMRDVREGEEVRSNKSSPMTPFVSSTLEGTVAGTTMHTKSLTLPPLLSHQLARAGDNLVRRKSGRRTINGAVRLASKPDRVFITASRRPCIQAKLRVITSGRGS